MTERNTDAVAVTGIGAICSLGDGCETIWQEMLKARSGIRRITRFQPDGLRTQIAGTVDLPGKAGATMPERCYVLAKTAIDEALANSALAIKKGFAGQLFLGAPPIEHEWSSRIAILAPDYDTAADHLGEKPDYFHKYRNAAVAERLATDFGVQSAPITVTTACASGASAIQLACEAIRRGDCDMAIAAATDGSVSEESIIYFSLLAALSTRNDEPARALRPFDRQRDGFVMAEGAAALVLEHIDHARARGAEILATIRGIGEAADTYHRTRSSPDAGAIIRTIESALGDAGIDAADISAVNAHGTGTPENDRMEYAGLAAVFGTLLPDLSVTSNKSMIGHTLSAAGAIEAVISVLSLRNGVIPPTINCTDPDPDIPLDIVGGEPRKKRLDFILSNSFGFGGQNVALIVGRHGDD